MTARQDARGGVRIEVADTGVGIHPAELPRIFERFYRGSEANEARGTGSGLGLAIVKSIVDMHHGSIEVESRVGSGSRFVVTLPRDPREATGPEASGGDPAGKVDNSSPGGAPPLNPDSGNLIPSPRRPHADPSDVTQERQPAP